MQTKKISYLLLISLFMILQGRAQAPHYTLQSNESGSNKSYVARDYVSLQPGFRYSASSGQVFNAKIDAGLLFPPTENTYALPNGQITTDPTQGAVVGAIPGQFAVSPTGAATYSIPIEVPAGINGMQPNIAVGYSSQAGYGNLGTGWNISGVSAITRGGKNLYNDTNTEGVKFDNTDPLYLDGQRLIQLNSESFGHLTNGAIYGTEIEDYSIVKILTNSENKIYFQITTQDGKILEFGKTEDSKIENRVKTLSWRLNKTTDIYGNSIAYTYVETESEYDNLLYKIEYGGQTILFDYIENNTYNHEVYIKDFKFTQSKLLQSITTKIGTTVIKKYQFDYNDQDKLLEIKLTDGNNISINPSKIDWGNTTNQSEFKSIGSVANSNLSAYPKGTSSVDFVDINGDGYNDRVERWIGNSSTQGFINVYFYNNTNKTYSTTISTSQAIAYTDYEKHKQQFLFVDINKDGQEEIIYTNNNNLHVLTYISGNLLPFFADGRGVFNTEPIIYDADKDKIVKMIPSDVNHDGYADIVIGFYNKGGNGRRGYAVFFGSKNGLSVVPQYKNDINTNYALDYFDFGDFNGDGKLDMFCIASKDNLVQPGINDEILFDNDYITISTSNNLNITNFYNSKPAAFKVIDLNKDGLSDWLYYSSEDEEWRLNKPKGIGLYDNNTTVLPFSGDDYQFVDINGDGLMDVVKYKNYERYSHTTSHPGGQGGSIEYDVYVYDYTNWLIYLNKGNGSFETPINFKSYNKILSEKLITLSDINGDGINDLIISQGSNTYALSMPQANHQNLVYSVTNGMGLTESVSYKNFSEYESDNPNELKAKVRPLHAPLLVVDTHTHVDGSKTVYSFEAPKYHTEGKGFLGFEVLETSNVDNNVKTTSYYEFIHYDKNDSQLLRPYFYPALRTQYTSTIGGSNDISTSLQTISLKVINSDLKRFLPFVSSQTNIDFLRNLTQTTKANYDNYPNDLTQTTVTGDLTTSTVTTFTGPPNKTPYLPSTVITTRTQDGQSFTKETDYSFTFEGGDNPYKIIGKTETVDPGDVDSVATTYSNFDQWGHSQSISITANSKTRSSTVKYYKSSATEANAGQYLRSRTNVLGETTNYDWNESTGLLESETDPRENTTTYKYSSFGQLKETIYPDGLRKASTLQWAGSGDLSGAKYYSYTEASGTAPIVVWYDVLGRAIQADTYGLNERKISVSTEYYTENDFSTGKRKGMVYRISEPYFEADASNKVWAKTLTYDQYGRTLKAIIPMGELSNQYSGSTTTVKTPESTTITTLNSAGQVFTSNVNGKTVTYEYYPSGLVKTSTPQEGKPITMVYNKQGKQIKLVDPNSGLIRSEYNGFGELTLSVQRVHVTGDSIRTIHTYKPDGRLETIDRSGEITTYSYSQTPNYLNRISTIEIKNKSNQVQNRQTFTYDPANYTDRVTELKEEIVDSNGNLKAFIKKSEYDMLGRVKKEVFPTGYYTVNKYDRYSNLTERKDGANRLIWKAVDENAKGQLLHVTKGAKTTTYDYYANGQTKEIKAENVVDMYYEYESQTHNLHLREDKLLRQEMPISQKETFGYDELNRLTSWTVNRNGTDTPYSITYDPTYGTITNKSDLGAFTLKYGGEQENGTKTGIAGGALTAPHALTSIAANSGITGLPSNFPSVDLNVSYTDFKKIATLSEGSKFYRLTYGTDDERIKSEYYANGQSQSAPTLTRYYLGNYEEEVDAAGNTKKIHYLSGAILIQETGQADKFYYSYSDFQGSLIALTDANGNVLQRYAYDPWGARRNPDNWTEKDSRTSWTVNRGYTGHEHLDAFGIINMNGRVYDPLTAQFFSPDPVLTDAGNWLDYNRFGYCLNNPFRYTDPSGYTWWAENGNMVITTAAAIVVGGVVAVATAGTGVPAMIASGMAAGAAGGFTGGAVGTALAGGSFEDAMNAGLQGAAMGTFMGAVTAGIGAQFGGLGSVWNELGRAGAHALAQGGFSAMRGGDFWQGAAAGFVSSLAGSGAQSIGIHGWGMVGVSAFSGGVGAAIAGGKAEEILFGIVSGAMVGALNHMAVEAAQKNAQKRIATLEAGIRNVLSNAKPGTTITSQDLVKNYGVPKKAAILINSFTVKSNSSIEVNWNWKTSGVETLSNARFKDGIIKVRDVSINQSRRFSGVNYHMKNALNLTGGAIGLNVNGKIDWDIYLWGNFACPDKNFNPIYPISE